MFSSEKYLEICNNVNVSKGFNSCEIGPEYSVAEIFYNSNDTLVICIAHVKWCLHDTTGCPTGWTNVCTTQPVVRPALQHGVDTQLRTTLQCAKKSQKMCLA